MMKNRQSEEIAQIMDALENESEDETESNSEDENDSYQPGDYDNSFDLSLSIEEAIEERGDWWGPLASEESDLVQVFYD